MPTVAIPITPDIATLTLPDGTEVDVRLGFGLSLSVDAVRPPAPPPPSGPSVRGTAQTGVNTATVVLPTNEAGDVMVVYSVGVSGSLPSATGWTNRIAQNDGFPATRLLAWTKVSTGNEATATFSGSLTLYAAVVVKGATGFDVAAAGSGTDFSAPYDFTCPSVTPSASPSLLLDGVDVYTGGVNPVVTMPASDTLLATVSVSGATLSVASQALSGTAPTGTRAGSADRANGWASGAVVIK